MEKKFRCRTRLLTSLVLIASIVCGVVVAVDEDENCEGWAQGGECTANPGYMLKSCPDACAKHGNIAAEESCEAVYGDEAIADCKAKVRIAWSSNAEGRPPEVNPNECIDRRPDVCTKYAADGDCLSNPVRTIFPTFVLITDNGQILTTHPFNCFSSCFSPV